MTLKQSIVFLLLTWLLASVQASDQVVTISTNNTPLDRKVLQAVSAEAFKRLNRQFRIISLPSERSLVSANAGEIDGEGLRIAGLSDKYPNLVQVDEPFVGISFVAFSSDATIKIDGWDSLAPYRVAFINGWKLFEAHSGSARVVNKVDTPQQMFDMLQRDRVDLVLYTLADGLEYTRSNGLARIAPLKPSLKDVDLYLYLHKKHADLAPKLAQIIRAMKADGSYNEILANALNR
jgi:polar amino acid transport system substrate-binding protein